MISPDKERAFMYSLKYYLTKKHIILLSGIFTILFALCMPDNTQLFKNYGKILTSQTQLITDFFEVGGLSATFFNAGLHFIITFILMQWNTRTQINGLQIGAVGIFVGHSFFGTHLLNIIPLILGVALYAKLKQQSFKRYTTISLFVTALSPIVSYVLTLNGISIQSILIASCIGIFLGLITPRLAEEFLKFHHGLTLYNFGFTTGLISAFFLLFLPYFNLSTTIIYTISTSYHQYLLLYFLLIFIFLCVLFLIDTHKNTLNLFKQLISSSGRVPDDFVSKFGTTATLLNMLLTSVVLFCVLLILQINFNALILGGLFTVMGFSAFGKHILNIIPVSIGVTLGAILLNHPLNDTRFSVTLLFATGLAPIAGFYGIFYGILAGFLHYNFTATVLPLHQGMTLYNNGFSTGFVAAILVPLIDVLNLLAHSIKQGVLYAFRKK